jgi:Na+-transporting methylmalonyl-CoA/oxaloacetate decarboxylase gamma subunit
MKRFMVLLLLIFSVACFAETDCDEYSFSSDTTILQISKTTDIPVKKLLEYLEIDITVSSTKTLAELQISNKEVIQALIKYRGCKKSFYAGIVLVGMSIVFLSLIIVGFSIAGLQYLNRKKKPKIKTIKTSKGKITAPAHQISSNGIIAAITAIYLHEAEVEEKNRLLLTWKRSRISMWSAANMMENKAFDNLRGK